MPWIKVYTELLDDPKIGTLSRSARLRFVELLLLAGEFDQGGTIPLDVPALSWRLRDSTEAVKIDVAALVDSGVIEIDSRGITVVKWEERQGPGRSEQREQAVERQKRHRTVTRDKSVTVTDVTRDSDVTSVTVTPPDRDQTETKTENRSGGGGVTRAPANAPPPDEIAFFADGLRYFGVGEPKRTATATKLAMFQASSGRDRATVLRGVWRLFRGAQVNEEQGKLRNGVGWALSQCESMSVESLGTTDDAMKRLTALANTPAAQLLGSWSKEKP